MLRTIRSFRENEANDQAALIALLPFPESDIVESGWYSRAP